ncbi:MAG: hypothetical protein KF878_00435 [Planctomycetes bacterium]|nr:hypothetical protein [Planctomycetota bacterium]
MREARTSPVEALTAEALRIVGDGLIGRGVEQVASGARLVREDASRGRSRKDPREMIS